MTGLALSFFLQTTLAASGAGPYEQAYKQAEANGQPILVLVGADWCPGCRTMKLTVLARMQQGGRFAKVNYAVVNTDVESVMASKLMQGGSIPQLIVYAKTGKGWHREQITGATSEAAVEGLLQRARDAQALAEKKAQTAAAAKTADASGGN